MNSNYSLESLINLILNEAEGEERRSKAPNDIQLCLTRWSKSFPQLTKEHVLRYLQKFNESVRPNLGGLLNDPKLLTFFVRYGLKNNSPFGRFNTNEFINISRTKLNQAELRLMDPGCVKALQKAEMEHSDTFNYGVIDVRDEEGNIQRIPKKDAEGNDVVDADGRTVTVPLRQNIVWSTSKMRAALETLKSKIKVLQPILSKLNDPKSYSFDQMNFILREYGVNIEQDVLGVPPPDEENETDDVEVVDTTKLARDDQKVAAAKKLQQSLTTKLLKWSSPDGKVRLYDINNQLTSIRFGYYFGLAGERLERLRVKQYLKNPSNRHIMMQWCTTLTHSLSHYNSYRGGSKSYKFYIVINDKWDISDMSDEDIKALPADDPMKNFNNLVNYASIICLQQQDELGHSDSMILCDLTDQEIRRDWSWINKEYPGLTRDVAEEVLEWKKLRVKELINPGDKRNRIDFDPRSEDYFGGAPQDDKKNFILGTQELNYLGEPTGRAIRGTISSADFWRTLSDENKKEYINLTDETNALDRWKDLPLYYEVMSERDIFNYFTNRFKRIGLHLLDQAKQTMIQNEYDTKLAFRYSTKNRNIKLLQQRKTKSFNLIDYNTLTKLKTNRLDYDNDYKLVKDTIMMISDEDSGVVYQLEEYIPVTSSSESPDSFWIIFNLHDPKNEAAFINSRDFLKIVAKPGEENPNALITLPVDPEELDFGSMKNFKSIISRQEFF